MKGSIALFIIFALVALYAYGLGFIIKPNIGVAWTALCGGGVLGIIYEKIPK